MNWEDHLKWGFVTITIMAILNIALYILEMEIKYIPLFSVPIFIIYGIGIPNIIIAYIVGVYGSLMPDIDIGTSKPFGFTMTLLVMVAVYFYFTGFMLGILAILIAMGIIFNLSHRGIMHRWYSGLIIGGGLAFAFGNIMVGVYFIIGFMTHLVCDR